MITIGFLSFHFKYFFLLIARINSASLFLWQHIEMESHTLLIDHLWWCSLYESCFCCSFCVIFLIEINSLMEIKCSGVSFTLQVHFWGGFSVSFAFVTLKHWVPCFQPCNFRNSFSGSIFQKIGPQCSLLLGTMSLYFVCFEFFHLLVHLLVDSILLPCCCASGGDSWVLGGL